MKQQAASFLALERHSMQSMAMVVQSTPEMSPFGMQNHLQRDSALQ